MIISAIAACLSARTCGCRRRKLVDRAREEAPLRRAAERSARCHSPPYGLLACRATHSALAGLLTQLSFINAGTDGGILMVNVLHEKALSQPEAARSCICTPAASAQEQACVRRLFSR